MRYTESQVSSGLLDQPPFAGEPKKLFICSTARSGSYLLCRYMINAGLGVPHEYFNPIIMRQIAARLGLGTAAKRLQWRSRDLWDRLPFSNGARIAEEHFLADYLAALIPVRCRNGIFAAKIHFEHFVKVLDNPTGRKLLQGGVFVRLYREDLLKQAVSTHFSNLTGRWGIDDTVVTPPQQDPNFFDVAAIDRTLRRLAEDDLGWRVFFAKNGISTFAISYEKLCEDPMQFLAAIANKVGLNPDRISTDYDEMSMPATDPQPGIPSRDEVISHYLTAVRTLPDVLVRPISQPANVTMREIVSSGQPVG